MTINDFKKLLDPIIKEVRGLKDLQIVTNRKLDALQETVNEHTDILNNRVLPSAVYIEKNIKAYQDMYQYNNVNSKRLEQRIKVFEDQAGIIVPPELTLKEVQ